MPNKKTILIDFDGVLASCDGWKGDEILGDPLPGARAACFTLAKQFKLICFTTRHSRFVTPWLTQHGFSCISGVTSIKLPAYLQIDDRVIQFKGWNDGLIETIKEFSPWWEKEEGRN